MAQVAEQHAEIAALHHEGGRAAADGLARQLIVRKPAEDHDFQVREARGELLDQRKAIAALKHEIEHDGIGMGLGRPVNDFTGVLDLTHTAHTGLAVDELDHDIAQVTVIFGDENAHATLHEQAMFPGQLFPA